MKIGLNLPLRSDNIVTLLYKINEPSYFFSIIVTFKIRLGDLQCIH